MINDDSTHEEMMIVLRALINTLFKYAHEQIDLKYVRREFQDFEVLSFSFFIDEPALYARGIFEVNGKPYMVQRTATTYATIQLLPNHKTYYRQLEKMGRGWESLQEFEDFKLLFEITPLPGERLLIEIED